ncbi:MAG: DUF3987 domain-containing protein [Planctomycetota bacterium]|nr:MAG: DUF3987 domain-containing protein [Planctomycetota bacterium]
MIPDSHDETRCTPLELVLSRLPEATEAGGGWSACCPAHEDGRASLSVTEGADGRVLLHCFAGCRPADICDALGLRVTDLFPRASTLAAATQPSESQGKQGLRCQSPEKPKGKAFATSGEAVAALVRSHGPVSMSWAYHDARGESVGIICRWDLPSGKKDIRPVSRHVDGWRLVGMPDSRPLYQLPELANADLVFVTEGEKAADAVRSIGLTATTSAHGSQSAAKSDWRPLAGKSVAIAPDHDPPGEQYAEAVAGILASLDPPATVKVVNLPGLPEGGDFVEWLAAQPDPNDHDAVCDALLKLVEAAEPIKADVPAAAAPAVDRWQPFPVDALPEPLRSFVANASKAIGCEPSFVALPILSACGAAIGNTARLEIKGGWHVPPILWTAVVGESGTAKTPAFRAVMKPVRARQHVAKQRHDEVEVEHQAAMAFYKRDMKKWESKDQISDAPPRMPDEPHAERVFTEDATVEAVGSLLAGNPRGMLLARDELSGWFGSFDQHSGGKGGADSAKWLSMYNGETVTIDRKTGTPRTICIPNAAMSIIEIAASEGDYLSAQKPFLLIQLSDLSPDLLLRDLNGQQFLVMRSNGTGYDSSLVDPFPPGSWERFLPGDFNGDGRTDMAGRLSSDGSWWISLVNGSGVYQSATRWGAWSTSATWSDPLVADFDGDGRDDLAGRVSNGDWWVSRSTGTALQARLWGNWNSTASWVNAQAADFNRDGRLDIAGRNSQGEWLVSLSSGTTPSNFTFSTSKWGQWSTSTTWSDVAIGDFNGDGRADIVGRSSIGQWWVNRSTGSSFSAALYYGNWSTGTTWADVRVADFDGNGLDDIIGRAQNGQWWLAESFVTQFRTRAFGAWAGPQSQWQNVMVGDANRDGRADLIARNADQNQIWTSLWSSSGLISSLWATLPDSPQRQWQILFTSLIQ